MSSQEHIDAAFAAAVAASAPKAMYAGAATSGLGWLVSSEGIAVMGLLLTLLGLLAMLYFNIRDDRRKEREHRARMKVLEQKALQAGEWEAL